MGAMSGSRNSVKRMHPGRHSVDDLLDSVDNDLNTREKELLNIFQAIS